MTKKDDNQNRTTRREFLKTVAITGAAGVLAGCSVPPSTPVSTPRPTAVPSTAAASPTPAASNDTATVPAPVLRRPELLKMYPDTASKVIHARHVGVWQNDRLSPEAMRAMLDASMVSLTGAASAGEAWTGLFSPDEKIAIKVNAFTNSEIFTHTELVRAVTDSLVDAGIPAEQIFVFDFTTNELTRAGYTVNNGQPGVQCLGTDSSYRTGYKVTSVRTSLSEVMLGCHALINMPVLKSHMLSGMTFALKNHFGTVNSPGSLHYPLQENIAALNALPEIKDRTRLIVGDVLEACLQHANSFPYWKADYRGDSILVSHDPVAVDTIGLDILAKLVTDTGGNPEWRTTVCTEVLDWGAKLGVGTNDPAQMELVEINL